MEQQQVLQLFFFCAPVVVHAEFELQTELLEEFFVLLTVFLQHGSKFRRDFLFQVGSNQFKLSVLLYRFTGNVEGQFAVHKTFDETVTIGNKVGAFVGDKHAVGVQFKPLFVTLVVVVVGGVYIVDKLYNRDKC